MLLSKNSTTKVYYLEDPKTQQQLKREQDEAHYIKDLHKME
jgi:hypothetical protein